MKWFGKSPLPPVASYKPVSLPIPSFKSPVEIMGHAYWQCTVCGSLVADNTLELHSIYHSRMDRLFERLIFLGEQLETAKGPASPVVDGPTNGDR